MAIPYFPFIGQTVQIKTEEGIITGELTSLSKTHCKVQKSDNTVETYPIENLKTATFNFPTFYDAISHLSRSGESRHCHGCYLAMLYGVDILATNFDHQAFLAREDSIKRSIVSYLQKDFASSAYSLFPQVDGITNQILHEDGLLKNTKGFSKWTKEHPVSEYHGKPCTNLNKALSGAADAGEHSRIRHIMTWLGEEAMFDLGQIRNKLIHGTLLDISEHQASILIILIQALHHGVCED